MMRRLWMGIALAGRLAGGATASLPTTLAGEDKTYVNPLNAPTRLSRTSMRSPCARTRLTYTVTRHP
jgi:hypothetical protein